VLEAGKPMEKEYPKLGALNIVLIVIVLSLPLIALMAKQLSITTNPLSSDCGDVTRELEAQDIAYAGATGSILILGRDSLIRWPHGANSPWQTDAMIKASRLLHPAAVAACFQRLVAHYQPTTTLLLLEPQDILAGSERTLMALEAIAASRIYWSSSPRFVVALPFRGPRFRPGASQWSQFEQAMNAIEGFSGLEILDLNSALLDDRGAPEADFYWPDGKTPSREAYQAIFPMLAQALELK
jgi:hypothetical protein